jgi:hypothetical protein
VTHSHRWLSGWLAARLAGAWPLPRHVSGTSRETSGDKKIGWPPGATGSRRRIGAEDQTLKPVFSGFASDPGFDPVTGRV